MNIAIFGGAFNPIHKAHTTLAENVLKECNVEKVIFIPTFISPHKSMQYAVPFEHRVNMCKIATKDNDNFIVSTLEENFIGKSYTYRTLEELKKLYPNDNLFLVTGADMYLTFLQWKNPDEIFSLATLITCPRDDGDYNSLVEYSKVLEQHKGKSIILKEPIMELSSTMVRDDVNEAFKRDLIDKNVFEYIRNNQLYGVK